MTPTGTASGTPTATAPVRGVILYPGAFIPSAAYAPLAYRLAERGFRVGLPNFLFNFALIAPRRAEKIIAAYPGIQHWTVGGHSLGGVAATKFVDNNPAAAKVSGVFYLASYPDEVNNLADQNLAVLSIYGRQCGKYYRALQDPLQPFHRHVRPGVRHR